VQVHDLPVRPDVLELTDPAEGRSAVATVADTRLSCRELEVLRLVADGYDTADVAEQLAYSESTIKGVLAKLMTRLEARNRCHAIATAERPAVAGGNVRPGPSNRWPAGAVDAVAGVPPPRGQAAPGAGSLGLSARRRTLLGCPVCGQALIEPGPCPNRWCHRGDRAFSVAFAVGVHAGALRHAVLRYKYGHEMWWADVFARLVADHLLTHSTWFEEFDFLVPTPSYLGPFARRRWDPVGEVAARLDPLVEPLWEVAFGVISKTQETPPMQGRAWVDRQAVAAGPLRRSLRVPNPRHVAGARILVLDDVLTEGSTLREVARALRAAGAREVAGLVLSRPAWRDRPPGADVEP
jgi:predicted amidophosphoribosyltransferase/DNA-binding CsgD family transcriptional regulator